MNELKHYGVLGMRWGRRKSASSTTLTNPSKDHVRKTQLKKKKISEMTNDELKEITNRLQLEKQYNDAFKKAYPLTPNECFKKEDWLNNKKHILVITLPSNFISILKILKTNKEQYFTLYKSKWSLKEKTFDAIVVDSSMPYHLEFYNSIKKYIKYKVPTYLLEKETLKTLK